MIATERVRMVNANVGVLSAMYGEHMRRAAWIGSVVAGLNRMGHVACDNAVSDINAMHAERLGREVVANPVGGQRASLEQAAVLILAAECRYAGHHLYAWAFFALAVRAPVGA